jgi:branched-chain amino acid transport system substrate-binding protein
MTSSWLKRLAIATGALMTLAGAARADIVIGVALPRTGPIAAIGEQIFHGTSLAAKDINDKGGVLGQKIVLRYEDDACDPKQAVSVANRFIQGKVDLVVGHVCSGASIVASDIYAENGSVMMSPASNSAKLTDRGLKGIFRVCGRDDDQGKLSAKIIAEHWGKGRIAILHDNTPFSKGLADATRDNLHKLGVTEALYESITPGERDYTAVITRLKAMKIDLVYYGGYQQEMGMLLRQAKDQAFTGQFFGSSGIATSELWAIAGPAANGLLFTFNPDPRKRPEAADAVKALKAEGFQAEGFTLYGYAAVQALAQAVAKGGSADPKTVEKTLKSASFDLVMGQVRFDQKGDVSAPGYVLYQWKDGKMDYYSFD